MKTARDLLLLMRWPNLLIVAFTQWMVWRLILLPLATSDPERSFLTPAYFALLCLSTVCLAAGSYLINDLYDLEIDAVNKPEKAIIGKTVRKSTVLIAYALLNLLGLGLGIYLSIRLGNAFLWSLQLLGVFVLWLYSFSLKRRFVFGNLAVSVSVAFTIFILAAYEPALYPYFRFRSPAMGSGLVINPFVVLCIYAYFAFMLTWIREIVKDMEDFKGDQAYGCQTMPIKIGVAKTQNFATLLSVFAISPLAYAVFRLFEISYPLLCAYVVLLVIAPMVYFLFFLRKHQSSAHYKRASTLLKVIMLLGLCTLLPYYYLSFSPS